MVINDDDEGIYVALPRLKKRIVKTKEGWLEKRGKDTVEPGRQT